MLDASQGNMTVKALDEMVDFLAAFVVEPEDPDEKREALLEASETQFNELLNLVGGSKNA